MSAARLFHSAALVALAVCASRCSLLYGFDYTQAPADVHDASTDDALDADDASEVGPPPCPAGFMRCESEACLDVQSNVSHCGRCNNVCAIAGATAACEKGSCSVASCNAGLGNCDGDLANGCETRFTTSTEHCGRCGARCAPEHAVGACVDAVCRVLACEPGYADCDGSVANGCEVDTRGSTDHCGGCGQRCAETGGSVLCAGGTCGIRCDMAHADCDHSATNGCEIDVASSTNNCGLCGNVCNATGGTASCTAGRCGLECGPGRGDCDGNLTNGCEINLRSSPRHCGRCGFACPSGQLCADGACVATCPAGQIVCEGRCVSTATDVTACGRCDVVCPARPNATPTCAASACAFACNAGWRNCNAMADDGCETNVRDSVESCGACGSRCMIPNAVTRCTNSNCEFVSCNAGFADCDGNGTNGCETSLATAAAHCGRCGNACATTRATAECRSGTCVITACDTGYADCNGDPADGCETNIAASVASCGRCGNACNLPDVATYTCAAGVCGVGTCSAGYADCDGNPANGCEVNLSTSTTHCGACRRACPGACAAGVCICGGSGQPCCTSGAPCAAGVCVAGTCRADCGSSLQGCCGGRCGPWNNCLIAACVSCGGRGQPCCAQGGACMGALNCRLGVCIVL